MATKSGGIKAAAESIAKTVADYRAGEIEPLTPARVICWAEHFEEAVREPVLTELDHIFENTYVGKSAFQGFLRSLTKTGKLTGKDPKGFWKAANILTIQSGGNSQRETLAVFSEVLKEELKVGVDECGSEGGPFVYLDDAIFSGNRVVNDFRGWIASNAPTEFKLHVVVAASHSSGDFYISKQLQTIATEAKKRLKVDIWRMRTFKNMSNEGPDSDVLRLRSFPKDPASQAFIDRFGGGKDPALLRPEHEKSRSKLFTTEEARDLLEREFWHAGLSVREACGNLKDTHRPLGYTSGGSANKLGFGSLLVTYRNCPNNCPLALWADDPWYPLFPRKTN